MKRTIRDVLVSTPALTSQVPAERWYAPGAVVDTPVRPFVVLRWLAPVPGAARGRFLHQLRVDVHDVRGSYARIEAILGSPDRVTGVYSVLTGLLNHVGVDGRITECNYVGHSGDQEDSTYNTNFKFSSWQVIGVDL
jgi:hypothetical protein